jgi:hypothetical protein
LLTLNLTIPDGNMRRVEPAGGRSRNQNQPSEGGEPAVDEERLAVCHVADALADRVLAVEWCWDLTKVEKAGT